MFVAGKCTRVLPDCVRIYGMSATASDVPTFEDVVTGEIRAEIARQRLNNRRLAVKMGRTHFWVGDRLNGRVHMEVQDLGEFADALGVSVEQLVRHQGLEPRTRWLSSAPGQADVGDVATVTYLDQFRAGQYASAVAV